IVRRKVDILLSAFASQAGKHWFDRETFEAMMRLRGLESASRYAEAFYGRKLTLELK
ncbi:PIG-L domain-containing protein, partial [candidate division GN15 bacterium]